MARYIARAESHCNSSMAAIGPTEAVATAATVQIVQARYCAGISLTGRANSVARPTHNDIEIPSHTHSRNCRNAGYQPPLAGIKTSESGHAIAPPAKIAQPRVNGMASIIAAHAVSRTRHSIGSHTRSVHQGVGSAPPIVVRIACEHDANIHADNRGQARCQPVRKIVADAQIQAQQYPMLMSQYGAMHSLYV